jgi:nitrite reductase (cytochrome c-552)
MEEVGLSHILNAEGEKLQYILGTLEGSRPSVPPTIDQVLEVNESVKDMLKQVAFNQMFLSTKMSDALKAYLQKGENGEDNGGNGNGGGNTITNGFAGMTVISAEEWFDFHPDVVDSYMRNFDNDQMYSYLELNPYKRILFEGFGFQHMYNSPRGHVFSLVDTDNTLRPTLRSNCFACKSANYPVIRAEMGMEFYATPFEDLRSVMSQPISCFNCHGNDPGVAQVTHPYLAAVLEHPSFNGVSMGSASCAQCHIEYHFHQETWEVIVPWATMADMHPVAMLATFNTLDPNNPGHDGEMPYADYTNPRSGVRQIKVQHPEFETLYSEGAPHNSLRSAPMGFSCADCHMPREVNDEGTPYISHEWMSPLNNMQLIQGTCFACHNDLYSQVRDIQADYWSRLHDADTGLGPLLEQLMERLVLAVESGDQSEETLDEIRSYFRNAQFFWDFAISENSNAAHNPTLIFSTIDNGFDYARTVEGLLNDIGF